MLRRFLETRVDPEVGIALLLGGFLLFIVIISPPTWIHEWREHRKVRKTAQPH